MDFDSHSPELQAYAIALRFLSKRAYAESRLRRTLSNLPKRFPQTRSYTVLTHQHISAAIARLLSEGLLDDFALGNRLWDSYERTHGFVACIHMLKRRGIAQSAIDHILAERKTVDPQVSKEIILAAHKKFIALKNRWKESENGNVKARNALFRFLAGRGYTYADVQAIVKKIT